MHMQIFTANGIVQDGGVDILLWNFRLADYLMIVYLDHFAGFFFV